MVKPTSFLPPDDEDDEEVTPEVTREHLERERKAAEAKARQAARESKTRRSWYTSSDAADLFQVAVDDIHHATRVPKHEVVAALLEAAVGQAERVQRKLSKKAHVSHS
ncbi:hypothetical protein [Streptomyces kronopolitis]|uniref:hypothetical protein n=1 Tax=Streptomyces kronopolitis TaxID=1612435 RepID=UPI003D955835